ncbi:hypothetical protein SAY87_010074 [Trapa incisa]|uniref:Uncharacterized protein n=1 Tax=Trapa incisa TaxID=236973 RepID=A0AAN7GPZ8_9MYRT|nr:hypothetical protein SAY87_010074 [Trapa incisa]
MASHLEALQQDVDIHARHFSSISTVDSEHNDEHGNPIWRNRVESWKDKKSKKNKAPAKANLETVIPLEQRMEEQQSTEASDTFSTVIPISKYKLRPYRIVIITRLIILALFFHYRVTISRTTYIDRLSASGLFRGQVSRYVSDDRAAMLTFESLVETADFARKNAEAMKVFLGNTVAHDIEGNELLRLVYVSREKRPGYQHHKKAGAENALVRVSAVLMNAPYILNLDCDHYVNNSKAIREAMCFLMDPVLGKDVCYVQFPQRFDGIDRSDRYANRNTVFFNSRLSMGPGRNLKVGSEKLDGLKGQSCLKC